MKKIILIISLIMIYSLSFAQSSDQAQIENINNQSSFGLSPAPTPFSLIDLSRVKWSNSYSVSFFSGGNNSGSVGLLNTQIFYEFSSKLSLALNIGIAHNPGNFWGEGNTNATILPSFQLDYHPSENFRLSIGMQQYNGYYMPYGTNNLLNLYDR